MSIRNSTSTLRCDNWCRYNSVHPKEIAGGTPMEVTCSLARLLIKGSLGSAGGRLAA